MVCSLAQNCLLYFACSIGIYYLYFFLRRTKHVVAPSTTTAYTLQLSLIISTRWSFRLLLLLLLSPLPSSLHPCQGKLCLCLVLPQTRQRVCSLVRSHPHAQIYSHTHTHTPYTTCTHVPLSQTHRHRHTTLARTKKRIDQKLDDIHLFQVYWCLCMVWDGKHTDVHSTYTHLYKSIDFRRRRKNENWEKCCGSRCSSTHHRSQPVNTRMVVVRKYTISIDSNVDLIRSKPVGTTIWKHRHRDSTNKFQLHWYTCHARIQ